MSTEKKEGEKKERARAGMIGKEEEEEREGEEEK
jgi:hypothetical protein